MSEWIYNRDRGHVEENGKYICDPRSDLHGEQIAREHNACLCATPDEWSDVTERCMTDGSVIVFAESTIIAVAHPYRIRKVKLWQPGNGGKGNCRVWAFCIDRKGRA